MPKKFKKILLPTTAIAISSYFSILFGLGLIMGYLGTKRFHDKFIASGRIGMIFLNFGKWQIHLHHWLIGVLIIMAIALAGWLIILPNLCLGLICGLSLHDLYFDKNWYKVVLKR